MKRFKPAIHHHFWEKLRFHDLEYDIKRTPLRVQLIINYDVIQGFPFRLAFAFIV